MPTECERTIVNTQQQNVPQTQQQQQQQQENEQLLAAGENLPASRGEEGVGGADQQREFTYDDMEAKELNGSKMSTSQTSTTSQISTTSSTNGHNGGNNTNGVGKKTSIISPDPTPYVTKARVTRPTPPPPPYNPMQFVQIKPCNLYQTAQEQLKKAEEVKKIKEIKKEDPEDWQNNLDNWKSSRRKRVEHIIDRVVEVKKLELEEHDRTRRKSKTFSEMIEERGERGGRGRVKLATLAVYNEDESNDLSDLGIGTSSASGKSSQSEDYDNNSVLSDNAELDKAIHESNQKPSSIPAREYISSPGYDTSSSTAPGSSPDPCEYTYEGAIQDYKQRVSRASGGSVLSNYKNQTNSKTHSSKETTPESNNTTTNNDTYPTRRGSKIEDRLMGFEVTSPSDSQEGLEKKVDVPKIDISKRKEIFENQNANTEPKSLGNNGAGTGGNIAVPRVTLRDRFKLDESANGNGEVKDSTLKREVKRLSGDITSVRSRMQSLEQQQNLVNSTNGVGNGGKTTSSKLVDIPVPPLKERLSSLQNAVTKEEVKKAPVALVDARQLEIMKNEEEQRKKQIEYEKREQQEQKMQKSELKVNAAPAALETTTSTQESVVVKIQAPEEEVDRDDSGIHTADGETDAGISEQEQQLNAAIAALALEEQQLTEAANAVNQIEAEFNVLSTSAVNDIAAATAKTTNEQPCEMEFSINEALELALEAIDKETKFTTNETIIKTTTKTLNTTAISKHKTTKTKIMDTSTKTTTLIDNNKKDAANRTDEEKEFKSKQQAEIMPNNYNSSNKNQNNSNTKSAIKNNDELNNKYVNSVSNYEDYENHADTVALETLISKEPIYENISAASTRQVDADADVRRMPNNNNNNNENYNQMFNQIANNNSNNNYDNSIANNANNLLSNLTNNNNNGNSNNNNSYNNNSYNNSNNNSRSSYNASINNNNNNQVEETSIAELTNAFANATTNLTTASTTTTKAATASLIASEKADAMLDNITTTKSPTTTIANPPTATKASSPMLPTNPTIPHKTTTPSRLSPINNQEQIELEPYYQVPKSSEPYYDAPKHLRPIPLYENIEVFYTGLENSTLAGGTGATLNSSFKLEPPKEKPPPPPVDSPPPFDDMDSIPDNTDTWSSDNTYETISSRLPHVNALAMDHPSPPIKRMNSTKRIKKELRNKRSSFLGIDTTNLDDDESYLELTVAPPPDMAQLLQEERRLEKQLYLKAGLCDSSDTGESRDSGVSENHSRQSSEHYTNSSEENDRQIDSPPHSLKSNDLIYQNEALLAAVQTPLLQTVKGNSAESWTESATVAAAATKSLTEATATANAKMLSIEEKIREQEEVLRVERELLQLEQEELKRQRENLMLRENMARRELQHGAKMLMSANRRSLQDLNGVGMSLASNGATNLAYQSAVPQYAPPPPHHGGQQPVTAVQQQQYAGAPLLASQHTTTTTQQIYANVPNLQQQYYQVDVNYRKSMSDLQEFSKRHMLPPPTPPTKPMRAMHVATNATNAALAVSSGLDDLSAHRNSLNAQVYGGSLVKIAAPPTAAPRGHTIYSNHQSPYHHQSTQNLASSSGGGGVNSAANTAALSALNGQPALLPGNMSRNTLHALSATPKPKYTDGWVQVQQRKSYDTNLANDPAWLSAYHQKRKSLPDAYHAYNNHWLVQEAEQRRIAEQRRVSSTGATPVHQQNGNALSGGGASALKNSTSANSNGKPLPDSIIQTLTERVQSKGIGERKRFDNYNTQSTNTDKSPLHAASTFYQQPQHQQSQSQPITPSHQRHLSASGSLGTNSATITATMPPQTNVNASPVQQPQQQQQDKVLSVSGKKKCSHCGDELGRGAAMIIESLLLFYHINCFKCCVCHVQLGDGLNGTDVRVRNHKLHCQNCYSSDDGIKFSCV